MNAARRFHLLLPHELEERLRQAASSRGVGLGTALREMAAEGLATVEAGDRSQTPEASLGLAALIACEQALLVVASILPGGRNLVAGLESEAAEAAQKRIAILEAGMQQVEGNQ